MRDDDRRRRRELGLNEADDEEAGTVEVTNETRCITSKGVGFRGDSRRASGNAGDEDVLLPEATTGLKSASFAP